MSYPLQVQLKSEEGDIIHCDYIKVKSSLNQNLYQKKIMVYDPFQIPPDLGLNILNNFALLLELARLHQKAKCIGIIDFQRDYDSRQLCPCCNLPFDKSKFSLCASTKDLGFLGQAFPLYFESIKLHILLLLLLCLTVSVYNVVTTAQYCYKPGTQIDLLAMGSSQTGCYNFMGIMYTNLKSDKELTIQAGLTLLGVLVNICGLYLIKVKQARLAYDTDETELTPSDYTIIIRNVQIHTSQFQIKQFFEKNFQVPKEVFVEDRKMIQDVAPKIERIIFATRIDDYVMWTKSKVALLTDQRKIFAKILTPQDLKARDYDLQKNIREMLILDQKIKLFEEKIHVKGDELLRCPYAFVTFETEEEMKHILKQNQESFIEMLFLDTFFDSYCFKDNQNYLKRFLNNNRIFIERAPEPLDIQWENLSVNHNDKIIRRLVSIFLSLLLIVSGATIIYGITYIQRRIKDNNQVTDKFFLNYVLSFLCALLILIINFLLCALVRHTSRFEKHTSFTSEIKSTAKTLIIMEFINTALVLFALFLFTRSNFNHNDLMASLFFIFLGNLFIVPGCVLLDPLYLWRIRKRRIIQEQGFRAQFTQMDVHNWFEGPDFDIADKYTSINKSILTATFYASIFPYGSMIEILALGVYYWVSKFVLLRRCAWPQSLSQQLQTSITNLITIQPLTLAFGGLCYEYVAITDFENLSIHIINIVIAFIGMLILRFINIDATPKNKNSKSHHVNLFFQFATKQDLVTFEEQRLFFSVDYDRCNPVTRARALAEWELIWRQKDGNNINPNAAYIPMIMNHNYKLLYGMNVQPEDQQFHRFNQVVPQERQPIIQEQKIPDNQMYYLPGNKTAEFHRKNMMCSQLFVSKQVVNKMNNSRKF